MGRLVTRARIPHVLGHAEQGFVELYEFDMWLNEEGMSESHVRRCGAPPYEPTSHDGYTPFDVLPGSYAILLHQPEWFVRPAVVADIAVQAGANPERNIIPALDYCCVSGVKLGPWERPGVPEPWTTARVFHQTFVARGTSITHAHFKLAGAKAPSAKVSIHEAREGVPPDQWKPVGPARIRSRLGSLNDSWVGWRSGEVPTTPGRRYALRIEAVGAPGADSIAMLVHRDALGPGYDAGTGYADGKRQPFDIYASISSDSDGTVIPYMRVHDIKPGKLGGSGTWAQTWVARGKSLAAADLLVAWGGEHKGVLAELRVHEDDPKGKVVGVAKRSHTAWWGPGHGFLGAAWQPGEVVLKPGRTYCLEFVTVPPCKGYNVNVVNDPANACPDGIAFRDGRPVPKEDLEMTIVEYVDFDRVRVPPPPYDPKGKNLLINGDFEQGRPGEGGDCGPSGWQRWSRSKTTFWYGDYGRGGSRAPRVIGGSINGTRVDGGFVQRVTGLRKDRRYRLSAWSSSSAQADKRYQAAVGYDPTGQTSDPRARTIVWTGVGRRSNGYEQALVDGIEPKRDAVSIWMAARNQDVGDETYAVDFDDFVLEEQGR